MSICNKLVRDKTPQIIESTGKVALYEIIDGDDYYSALLDKLKEEVNDFDLTENPEDIADILEVLDAIVEFNEFDWDEIMQIKTEKLDQSGGYEKGVFLKEVIE